jgi:hypothetical protein
MTARTSRRGRITTLSTFPGRAQESATVAVRGAETSHTPGHNIHQGPIERISRRKLCWMPNSLLN